MLTQDDLNQIRTIVKDEVTHETKGIKKDLKKISGQLNTTIKFFDNSWLTHEKRLDRIDSVLHLPKLDPSSVLPY